MDKSDLFTVFATLSYFHERHKQQIAKSLIELEILKLEENNDEKINDKEACDER